MSYRKGVNFVSCFQLEKEKEINEIKRLCLKGELTDEEVEEKMSKILTNEFFSELDIKEYYRRRDGNKKRGFKPRSNAQFFRDLTKYQSNEPKILQHLIKYEEKKNRTVEYCLYGSDNVGNIIIANFWEREAAKPDYKIILREMNKEKKMLVEIKQLTRKQVFKINNLYSYKQEERNTTYDVCMLVHADRKYYVYSSKAIDTLINYFKKNAQISYGDKKVVLVSPDNEKNCLNLNDLIKEKKVITID